MLDWTQAPDGWDWAAQDEDGRWYWYRVVPRPSPSSGVWRSHSSQQRFALQAEPEPRWLESLSRRPPE